MNRWINKRGESINEWPRYSVLIALDYRQRWGIENSFRNV